MMVDRKKIEEDIEFMAGKIKEVVEEELKDGDSPEARDRLSRTLARSIILAIRPPAGMRSHG